MNKHLTSIFTHLIFTVLVLLLPAPASAQIVVNELMAANTTIPDEFGEFDDWIELHNTGTAPVNLAGHYLSDTPTLLTAFQVPNTNAAATTIPAGGYLVFWADNQGAQGPRHASFKLAASGESVILTAPDGTTIVSQVTFPAQINDVSYGRLPNATGSFAPNTQPTPGAANVDGGVLTFTSNFIFPHLGGNDDVEQNSGGGMIMNSSDIELVQDGAANFRVGLRFPNVTIPPGATITAAYIQFTAEEVQVAAASLTIKAHRVNDAPAFEATANNVTSRPTTTASVAWVPAPWPTFPETGTAQRTPSLVPILQEIHGLPGWAGGNDVAFIITGTGTRTAFAFEQNAGFAAKLYVTVEIPLPSTPITGLFINEISPGGTSYVDEAGERDDWLEIYNSTSQPIDLGGLYLTDNFTSPTKWQVPAGQIVPAGGFLTFFTDDDALQGARHATFSLRAGGERAALVQVLSSGPTFLDSMSYPDVPFGATYGRQTNGSATRVHFGQITPAAANNGALLFLPAPTASLASGLYPTSQNVTLTHPVGGTTIRYTLDGSQPSATSTQYNGAIGITQTSSLRAMAFKSGYAPSPVTEASYYIGSTPNIPTVFLTTDPYNLFDDEDGIYVIGTNGVNLCGEIANYNQEWERPANAKMYLPNGELVFDVNAGIEIAGVCSRNNAQKSFDLNLREKEFGDDQVDYPLFPQRDHSNYQRLKLRNSGQDYSRIGFRDVCNQLLHFGKADIELQAARMVLLYLNGDFWGIYSLQEKYTDEFFNAVYGVDEDSIDIIKSPGLPWREIKDGTDARFNQLYSFVDANSLTSAANYQQFSSEVEVDEFLNYWIAMTYMANNDWPANNLTVWRSYEPGSKWRYCMADTDGSTGNGLTSLSASNYNTLAAVTDPNSTNWPNHKNSTLFLRKLLERPDFKNEFAQRTCSFINLIYPAQRVAHYADSIMALMAPNVPAHLQLYGENGTQEIYGKINALGGTYLTWEHWVDEYKEFYVDRPGFMRGFMQSKFSLTGTYQLTFNYNAATPGSVVVNWSQMEIPFNYTGTYFKGIPLRVKAIADPGHSFLYWLETGNTNPEIEFVSNGNATLTPVFDGCDNDTDGDGICDDVDCAPNNPALPTAPGTTCNDGNPNTSNDVIQPDGCTCAGSVPDPCAAFGGDSDGDGICNNSDCAPTNPALPTTPGSACNDGNANTTNDVVQANGCTCAGTPTNNSCNNITAGASAGAILVNGLFAPRTTIRVFNSANQVVHYSGNLQGITTYTTPVFGSGTYSVLVKQYLLNFVLVCQTTLPVNIGNGCTDADGDMVCAPQDCNDNNATVPDEPGTPCNDGNPNTTNDVLLADGCTCAGTTNNSTCRTNNLLLWPLDACNSQGTASYAELTPTTPSPSGCASLTATTLFRDNPATNPHNCSPGFGGQGLSVGVNSSGSCNFTNSHAKTIRFSVTVTPGGSNLGRMYGLQFQQRAPATYTTTTSTTSNANFPTKVGVRVLKAGVEVFKVVDLATTSNWSLKSVDFTNDPDFEVSAQTTFDFEILAYCPASMNYGGFWNMDNVAINGCCSVDPLLVEFPGNGFAPANDMADFEVYPNPTDGQATLSLAAMQGVAVDVQVFNQLGTRVRSLHLDEEHGPSALIDLSELPSGNYTVWVGGTGLKHSTKKLALARD